MADCERFPGFFELIEHKSTKHLLNALQQPPFANTPIMIPVTYCSDGSECPFECVSEAEMQVQIGFRGDVFKNIR